jgi:hypothetical protein
METTRDPSKQWLITGLPGGWCNNFTYFSIAEALLGPIDLVIYANGEYVYGQVAVEKVGDVYRFTVTPDLVNALVYRTHYFVGTLDEFLDLWKDCDSYKQFTTIDTPGGEPEHVFEAPVSSPEGTEFDGSRWGWYVTYCPVCI